MTEQSQQDRKRALNKAYYLANQGRLKEKNRLYREANGEAAKQCSREWRARNGDRHLRQMRQRYAVDREILVERCRKWRVANLEKSRSYSLRWQKENPEKAAARNRARSHRRRKLLIAGLMKLQQGKCAYCREALSNKNINIDHIMPVFLGGTNAKSNLQLTCEGCNLSKSAKHPLDYARSLGRLL